jgi:hypothetical protein
MQSSFIRRKLQDAADEVSCNRVDAEWQREQAKILIAASEFLSEFQNFVCCFMGVVSNESMQLLLFHIFKSESKTSVELRGFAQGCGAGLGCADDGREAGPATCTPTLLTLARGVKVSILLAKGASNLAPDDSVLLPSHMKAFRAIFCRDDAQRKTSILVLWRSLFPGHAQMWYRLFVGVANRWPFQLLLLIDLTVELHVKRQVALSLLVLSVYMGVAGWVLETM